MEFPLTNPLEDPKTNSDASSEAQLQSTQTPSTVIQSIDSKEQNGENGEVPPSDLSKKYSKISDQMRKDLIEAVESNGEKIVKAANRLNINYSSAKSILKVFKNEGREKKKTIKQRIHKGGGIESSKIEPSHISEASNQINKPTQNLNEQNLSEPLKIENQSTQDKKDTLTELHDRLLQSRLQKRQNPYDEDLLSNQKSIFNNLREMITQSNFQGNEKFSSEKTNQNQQQFMMIPQQGQMIYVPQNFNIFNEQQNQTQFTPTYMVTNQQNFLQTGNEGGNILVGQNQNYEFQNMMNFANNPQIYQVGSTNNNVQQSQQPTMEKTFFVYPQSQNITFQQANFQQQNPNFSTSNSQFIQVNNSSVQQPQQYYYMVPNFNFTKNGNQAESGQQFNYIQPMQQVQFLQPIQQVQNMQPLMYMVPQQVNTQANYIAAQQYASNGNFTQNQDERLKDKEKDSQRKK